MRKSTVAACSKNTSGRKLLLPLMGESAKEVLSPQPGLNSPPQPGQGTLARPSGAAQRSAAAFSLTCAFASHTVLMALRVLCVQKHVWSVIVTLAVIGRGGAEWFPRSSLQFCRLFGSLQVGRLR
jgi:hypothetical protein